MNISVNNYWDNTLQVCKSALAMLSTFEADDYTLINKTIEPLRELIRHGSDFETLKAFHSQPPPSQPSTLTKSKGKGKQVLESYKNSVEYHLDPSWTVVDDKTVNIAIESTETVIVAKAVTTPEELDNLVSRMYEKLTAALDCEFIALKNVPPQLQLLQVAVSTTEGYAIIVDKVGIDALNAKLKPCLEDPKMNFVGWAFRGDALAIESSMKGINLGPILDLQAKLRPIAVEEMNLYSGVSNYASEWDALEQFQNAKLLGGSFDYHEGDCIWLKDPLPPAALVYSVFDVVSLMALLDSTKMHPTKEDHYWPLTITRNAGRKSLTNWHKQRAMGHSAPIVDTKDLKKQNESNFSAKKGYNKQRKKFNFTNQSEYDPETQYKDDMQKALYLSLQENTRPSGSEYASSSKAQDRVIDFDESEIQFSEICAEADLPQFQGVPTFADKVVGEEEEEEEEEPVLECTWGNIINEEHKPFLGLAHMNQVNSDDSNSSDYPVPASPAKTKEEIQITILKRPVEPVKSPSPYSEDMEKTPSSVTTTCTTADSSQVRQLFDAKPKQLSQDSNNNSNSNSNSLFSSKPDKSKYAKDMKTGGGVSSQTGTFGWDDDTYNNGGGRAWKEFAQTAKTGWSNLKDTNISAIDEIKPSTPATAKPQEELKFNTSFNNVWHTTDVLSSDNKEWDIETEKPTVMKMQITTHKIRKSKGPRYINPIDSDYSDDDSDDDSDDTKNDADNDKKSGSDDKNSTTYLVTSRSSSEYHSNSQESNQESNQWVQWSSKGYSGNQYSRRSSHERNSNISRSVRGNWSVSGDKYTGGYHHLNNNSNYNNNHNNHNNHNNSNGTNYNNRLQYNNYNYNNNNSYNNNYNNNSYNNNYSNSSNNNSKWKNRNSCSSLPSSQSTTPQPVSTKQVVTSNTTQRYDELEIYVNEFYTSTGDYIKLFKLTQPSHLDQIILPSLDTQFTVSITFHLVKSNNNNDALLKAMQFYLPDNSSFNVIIGKACHENSTETTLESKFNTLLTHPKINRVAWFTEYFSNQLKEKTGVEIGRVVDLGYKVHALDTEGCGSDFMSMVKHYLKDWPSLEQFIEAKEGYDHVSRKAFDVVWDRDRIPDSILEYASLQGAALFKLYHHSTFSAISDENYIYVRK